MIKKSQWLSIAAASLFVAAVANTAQAATWGAQAAISMITPCPSFCGGPGGQSDFSLDGGEFSSSAFTTPVCPSDAIRTRSPASRRVAVKCHCGSGSGAVTMG